MIEKILRQLKCLPLQPLFCCNNTYLSGFVAWLSQIRRGCKWTLGLHHPPPQPYKHSGNWCHSWKQEHHPARILFFRRSRKILNSLALGLAEETRALYKSQQTVNKQNQKMLVCRLNYNGIMDMTALLVLECVLECGMVCGQILKWIQGVLSKCQKLDSCFSLNSKTWLLNCNFRQMHLSAPNL